MRARREVSRVRELCSGPGKLCQALAVTLDQSGTSALREPYALLGRPPGDSGPEIVAGPRIGLTKAAELPWRYCEAGSDYLSRPAG